MERVDLQQNEKLTNQKVVVFVDENSEYVIEWIKKYFDRTERIILINRRLPIDTNPSYLPFIEILGYDHDIHKRMHSFLKNKSQHVVKGWGTDLVKNGFVCDLFCIVGSVEEMLENAEQLGPDFVVVGSRNSLKILGSTSNSILSQASVPVMLIKEK
jgi:nucleotide-binding universal stress UspA family protein